MNPHFIFNALNSIHGFFASNELARGNNFMAKFSNLVRRILDQSNLNAHTLEQEMDTLRLYLDIEKERMGEQLSYSIEIDESVEGDFIEIPPLIVQPFVENAIWHGIAGNSSGGHVSVNGFMQGEDILCIEIVDNGVGLDSTEIKEHSSKGIKIARERLGPQGRIEIGNNNDSTGVKVALLINLDDE